MLADHARARIGHGLRRFDGFVGHVELVFEDLNGPRGGERHAACRVIVELRGGRLAGAQARERHFYAAASSAARLAGRIVVQELARARQRAAAVPLLEGGAP
jgi:hypothetical protein